MEYKTLTLGGDAFVFIDTQRLSGRFLSIFAINKYFCRRKIQKDMELRQLKYFELLLPVGLGKILLNLLA